MLTLEEILHGIQERGETYEEVIARFEDSNKLIVEARLQKRTKIQWLNWIDRLHYQVVVLKRKKE